MSRPEAGSSDTGAASLLIFGTGAQTKYVLESCAAAGRPVAGVVGTFANAAEREASGWPGWTAAYGVPLLNEDAAAALTRAPDGPRHYISCHSKIAPRRNAAARAEALGLAPATAVHPAAVVARTATVGPGSIVNAGAVIQPFARLGAMCMIHATAVIEHDAVLGDSVNIAPGARLAGWVQVGAGSVIYTGANVIPTVRIGAGATVAAGATVTEDVPDGGRVAGVPARPI